MQNEIAGALQKLAGHFSDAVGVDCTVVSLTERAFLNRPPEFCAACPKRGEECSCESTQLYGCYEAERWQGKYIYYCADGLIFTACSTGGSYGIVAGPVIMGELADFLIDKDAAAARYKTLPVLSTGRVGAISETLCPALRGALQEAGGADSAPMADSDFLNMMYTLAEGTVPYPIESEKALLEAIKTGNKAEAQKLLNNLLGHIYFCSGCDFKKIKVRMTELLVLLSRASIEGGADMGDIFGLSEGYFKEIDRLNNLEELSVWLSGAMHRYISYVFDFQQVKHSDVIFKTIQYIRARYAEKLTLEDIARNVFLSKSYLCKLFKEETEINITSFINTVRVEKSKAFLLDHSLGIVDIAAMTGFVDQSYFTKVFKKITGVSPGRFRESSGKIN